MLLINDFNDNAYVMISEHDITTESDQPLQ